MIKKFIKKAFTLAEVMVVLAIVTTVVGVSIKIQKNRFDAANRYLYYATYSALKSVVTEMYLDSQIVNAAAAPTEQSLPTENRVFCTRFAEYANTSRETCNGSPQSEVNWVVNSSTERTFINLDPDIILKNGIRLFNMQQVNYSVPILSNFKIYNESGTEIAAQSALAKNAYIIYADIDGTRLDSVLWEDVFPFYVTLNGYVIPAFELAGFGGANNIDNIAASVEYDDTTNALGRPVNRWLIKNVTWQEAACRSGYVNGTYCTSGGFTVDATCDKSAANFSDCRVKIIVPLKG